MRLESSPDASIDEDESTAPEIRSDLITVAEVDEACMEDETDFERQDDWAPEMEAEAEVSLPSAES